MTHHGDDTQHTESSDQVEPLIEPTNQQNADEPRGDAPVGGALGSTGTEGNGMPEQVIGDALHTDGRAQTAEESVGGGGTVAGGQAAGGLGTAGLGEDQLGGGLEPDGVEVSADPLDGQNATGGYGDESTGLSDNGGDPVDRDPGEDATTINGGNADR
jgi:hypothetical protein